MATPHPSSISRSEPPQPSFKPQYWLIKIPDYISNQWKLQCHKKQQYNTSLKSKLDTIKTSGNKRNQLQAELDKKIELGYIEFITDTKQNNQLNNKNNNTATSNNNDKDAQSNQPSMNFHINLSHDNQSIPIDCAVRTKPHRNMLIFSESKSAESVSTLSLHQYNKLQQYNQSVNQYKQKSEPHVMECKLESAVELQADVHINDTNNEFYKLILNKRIAEKYQSHTLSNNLQVDSDGRTITRDSSVSQIVNTPQMILAQSNASHQKHKSQYDTKQPVQKKLRRYQHHADEIRDIIMNAFARTDYLSLKELLEITEEPPQSLKSNYLDKLCIYYNSGDNRGKYSLKFHADINKPQLPDSVMNTT